MKKIAMFLLVLVMMLSLVACKGGKDPVVGPDGGDNQPVGGEEESFNYNDEYIAKHLNGDYLISYKLTTTDSADSGSDFTILMMHNSEGYYIKISEDTEILYLKNGDMYDMYLPNGDNQFEKIPDISYTEEDVKTQSQAFMGYMSAYSTFSDYLKKSGSATVAGRSCIKYKYDYSAFGVKVKGEYCIDKETGVCLKYVFEGSSGGEIGSYQFECTEFKTRGISLPSHT